MSQDIYKIEVSSTYLLFVYVVNGTGRGLESIIFNDVHEKNMRQPTNISFIHTKIIYILRPRRPTRLVERFLILNIDTITDLHVDPFHIPK